MSRQEKKSHTHTKVTRPTPLRFPWGRRQGRKEYIYHRIISFRKKKHNLFYTGHDHLEYLPDIVIYISPKKFPVDAGVFNYNKAASILSSCTMSFSFSNRTSNKVLWWMWFSNWLNNWDNVNHSCHIQVAFVWCSWSAVYPSWVCIMINLSTAIVYL